MDLSEAPRGYRLIFTSEAMMRGCCRCDGEGHIASGVGSLVGFEWWPIKVEQCEADRVTPFLYLGLSSVSCL